ncbi:ABC transporter substrate-binding protein [Sediminibacillus halophilus]|uniref:ABC-type nitrate/sulfonate/bicarbonate transport system, substrate-binding protein n=1 Tax=Sediminibacillus halophilus TaxID=482461 RepID=A0A1G9WYA5_9BACI|nr:ABC transporter substrate-binding protein [Sediminibacillus halophilus]SDM89166.1 ABC-type nitrate/sulfonate/bicarbonate transport system, substrate-binding protein [Sediminibacillus halophilus]
MKKLLIMLVALLLLATGCSSEENSGSQEKEALKKVSLVLDWTPNTNHTGIYAAQEKGYFEEEGLDVEILMPGEAGADQLVASGKADFGIGAQEALTEARVQDIPIVSIAAIIQHNTSGFASPKEKGITSPKDFEGKTYGGWGAPVEKAVIDSLMKQENADVEKVNIVNMGDTDFFTAVERDIDFAWIYYGWTGVEAELRGKELNMQYLTDYSKKLDYYTPVLTTSEQKIADDPETVEAFVAAVSKGYQFAAEQPDKAADILIDAVPDLDAELVKASQQWLSPKYQDDAPRWGEQQQQVWENYADWMYDNGLLDHELEAEKAFTNKFLPDGGEENNE